LKSAVERPAGNHVEGDIGITVIDPVVAGAPGDHGEDDHPETVHETCLEERPAQGEAAKGAHRAVNFPLHLSHSLDRIPAGQPGISPWQRELSVEENITLDALLSSVMLDSSSLLRSFPKVGNMFPLTNLSTTSRRSHKTFCKSLSS